MPSTLIKAFQDKIAQLETTRAMMHGLFDRNTISEHDLEAVYEGLFLRGTVAFESLLESLFFKVLAGTNHYPASRVQVLVRFNSDTVMRQVALQGEKFLDWLPYSRTIERANIYLDGGRPFSDIDDGKRSQIAKVVCIRHAIAHGSSHALFEFDSKVIGSTKLRPEERHPAGFLRSIVSQNVTRYQVYFGYLLRIAQDLR